MTSLPIAALHVLVIACLAVVVQAPSASAKLIPEDTLVCEFDGYVRSWASEYSLDSGSRLNAVANCYVRERDGVPADGLHTASFQASGTFVGGHIRAWCNHGRLDGEFTLTFRDPGGNTVEHYWGAAHIQFGYGETFGSNEWGWYDTGSAPGHIQLAHVRDQEGRWGGSAEGVIELAGYCSSYAQGVFVLHV